MMPRTHPPPSADDLSGLSPPSSLSPSKAGEHTLTESKRFERLPALPALPAETPPSNLLPPPTDVNPALLPIVGLPSQPYISDYYYANPWDDLEHYKQPYYELNNPAAVQSPTSYQARGPFPITNFPFEVIYCIAEVLPPESAACLALVNKSLYDVLGKRFVKEGRYSNWRLLVLLEKDLVYLVACGNCDMLHSPLSKWTDYSTVRCLAHDRSPCLDVAVCSALPDNLTYPLVRSIAKAHLQNRSYSDILTYANCYFAVSNEHLQYCGSSLCRIVEGNLLVRTQTILHLGKGDMITMRSLWELSNVFKKKSVIQKICRHNRWDEEDAADLYVYADEVADCHDEKHHCAYNKPEAHGHLCFSGKAVLETPNTDEIMSCISETLECTLFGKKEYGRVGKIQGCNRCFTDYSATFVDIDGIGRCIVATTWKDLGGLKYGEEKKWDSHLAFIKDRSSGPPGERVGYIYRVWEGVDTAGFDLETHLHRPQISQRAIDKLKKDDDHVDY